MTNTPGVLGFMGQLLKRWALMEVDARGRLQAPAALRKELGIDRAQPVLYRSINGVIVLVPVSLLPASAAEKPDEIDAFVQERLRDVATPGPSAQGDVAKEWVASLKRDEPVASVPEAAPHTALKDWLVMTNGKGFLALPPEVKNKFGIAPGKLFMIRAAVMEGFKQWVLLLFRHEDISDINQPLYEMGRTTPAIAPRLSEVAQPPMAAPESVPPPPPVKGFTLHHSLALPPAVMPGAMAALTEAGVPFTLGPPPPPPMSVAPVIMPSAPPAWARPADDESTDYTAEELQRAENQEDK